MKLEKTFVKRTNPNPFSGKVEIAVTGIDTTHKRMIGQGARRSFHVADTTVEEVYEIISKAIISYVEGQEARK